MMIENADLKSMFPMIAAGASTFLDEKYLWDVPQLQLLVIFNRAHVGYYSHRVLDMSCYFVSLVSSLSLKQLGPAPLQAISPFLTCTTGAQHRTLKERPILSGYRWQF